MVALLRGARPDACTRPRRMPLATSSNRSVVSVLMRQCCRDEKARVVVHECRQVQALVASKQKREDVRLPHLIRRRALEAARPVLTLRCRRLSLV